MRLLEAPSLDEIRAAGDRIADCVPRTPLVRLDLPDVPTEIWLKLENLQPIGSFKLRGAGNAMARLSADELAACYDGNSSGRPPLPLDRSLENRSLIWHELALPPDRFDPYQAGARR